MEWSIPVEYSLSSHEQLMCEVKKFCDKGLLFNCRMFDFIPDLDPVDVCRFPLLHVKPQISPDNAT